VSLLPWPRRRTKPDAAAEPGMGSPLPARHAVSAGADAVAVGGDVKGSALAPHSTVTYAENLYLTQAGTGTGAPVKWPVVTAVPSSWSVTAPRLPCRRP
jgi:hypothetical protein